MRRSKMSARKSLRNQDQSMTNKQQSIWTSKGESYKQIEKLEQNDKSNDRRTAGKRESTRR